MRPAEPRPLAPCLRQPISAPDVARTFVAADSEMRVVGYYTLVAGQVDHANASDAVSRGISPHFPIPVCLIARVSTAPAPP